MEFKDRPSIPSELKRQILMESGFQCAIPSCRKRHPHIHHIVPYSKKAEHRYKNLIALCPEHHDMADRGEIDRSSLYMYKDNLRFAIDAFSAFEVDLLFYLAKQGLNKGIPFPSYLFLLVYRLLEAEYVNIQQEEPGFSIGNKKISLDTLTITKNGLDFTLALGNRPIGYKLDAASR